MPRPLWSGSISFGLVNVPVVMFSAARDLGVRFNQLHEQGRRAHRDAPVLRRGGQGGAVRGDRPRLRPRGRQDGRRHRRGAPGGRAARARGRSTSRRSPTSPTSTRSTSTIRTSSPRSATPTARAAPTSCSSRRWTATEQVAIGRFVMRTKEYLVAIQVRDGRLALTTMRWGDEIRPTKGIDTGGQEAREGAARPGGRADRGAGHGVGAGGVGGPLPRAARGRHRAQAQGPDDQGARAGARRALARARPHGRARAEPRRGRRGGRREARPAPEQKKAEARDGELADLSREELYERAQEEDVPGRSSMSKGELIDALDG